MKITGIDVYQVDLPLVEGDYKWSEGKSVATFDSTVVAVHSDAGITGWGEVCPLGPVYLPAYANGVRTGIAEIAPQLMGLDPTQLVVLNRTMDYLLKGHPYVKSAIDMACWDITGKAAEMPVCDLLGGRFGDDVTLYRAISQRPPDEMAGNVAGYRAEGYRRFQLKVGGNPDEDIGYFAFTSFTQPQVIYRTSIASGAVTEWTRVTLPVDTSKFAATQVRYPSKDGTSISMFIIHRSDVVRDGNRPVLLYGYGGFNVTMTPTFAGSRATWLEHGGVYAIPNLRGGGEYGEGWHKGGMLAAKQNTFDDFIAAAEYLIAERWTSPPHLGIMGGSNGGLLVGAVMTQRPELFGAVVCAVPLLDMLRYHLYGSGKTWIPEYGDPERADDFAWLWAYSPYRVAIDAGPRAYPALLIDTSDHDDRVDPMHARKMFAAVHAVQTAARPVLLRIERNAGHGGADLVKQQVESTADELAFLLSRLA